MKRGLVAYGAMDDGRAVGLASEVQPVEPGGPPLFEVSHHADLVPVGLMVVASRCVRFDLTSFTCRPCGWISAGVRTVSRLDRNLGARVVVRHHRMWWLMW